MTFDLSCFKAYDIRGRVPDPLNADLAQAVGRAFAEEFAARNVVVGHDARLSGPELRDGLVEGLREAGADVTDLGLCGTEEIYYAAFAENFDGGIMITGSHNPADENGMKMVRRGAIPVSGDSGLRALRDRVAARAAAPAKIRGAYREASFREQYVRHLLGHVDREALRPLRIHADPGNGCAGPVLEALAPHLPFRFSRANMEPDGTFPHGVPNPLLPEKRAATARAVCEAGADFGIAWDGDFDRCFLYNDAGEFIEGYYIVGLLAESLLRRHPGAKIIHDPRLTWNTRDIVARCGGVAVESKTGHAFIKERMRAEDAVYGGEMSAHHYFRDFAYCDSGMIPWLLTAELISRSGRSLTDLVGERMRLFPCSGEINRRVADAGRILDRVRAAWAGTALREDHTDGLSLEFSDWRFNLRSSNTEPLLRLNVESRGDRARMEDATAALLAFIDAQAGAEI